MVGDSYLHQKASLCLQRRTISSPSLCNIDLLGSQSLRTAAGTQVPAGKLIHNEVMEPCWTGVSILKMGMRWTAVVHPVKSTKADRLMGIMADWVGLQDKYREYFSNHTSELNAYQFSHGPDQNKDPSSKFENWINPVSKHRFPCGLAESDLNKGPNMSELQFTYLYGDSDTYL